MGRHVAPPVRRIRWTATLGPAVTCAAASVIPAQAESGITRPGGGATAGGVSVGAAPGSVTLGPAPGTLSTGARTAARAAVTVPGATMQTHYAAPLRSADGTVDAARTLDAIRARGSRTYSYLIYPKAGYHAERDWATLPAFLVAARARGIKVTVTLTPPATTSTLLQPCSSNLLKPFGGRYDTWMLELGRLARRHPNLAAVAMDDYAYSSTKRASTPCPVFAPGTITRWNGILTRFAGRPLRVIPVMYLRDILGGRATYWSIQHEAPEIIWPYTESGEGLMTEQYAKIKKYAPKTRVHVMVYATKFRNTVPTPAAVRQEIATAHRLRPASVVIYQQRLD